MSVSQTPPQISLPIEPPPFLDVAAILVSSEPPRRINLFWPFLAIMGLLTALQFSGKGDSHSAVQVISSVALFGMLTASIVVSVITVRKYRAQQQTVDAIEEMMQLRRWEPAGILLNRFLSTPVRTPQLWGSALVRLAELLGRHHRFEDCLTVQTFLIDNELLDDQSDYFVRLSRAMAMLREDHLVDADRAISDLRRRRENGETASGGLALVEMFRDVKTGHPDEAIEIFNRSLPAIRAQLGHRVADAHALVARAYDLLGDDAQARAAYERATVLAPLPELQRRYPELLKLADKYSPAPAPKEAV